MLTIDRAGRRAVAGFLGQVGQARRPISPRVIKNIAAAAAADELRLYAPLGELGTDVADFARQLDELDGGDVDLTVSSEGGNCFTGLAVYALLSRYRRGKITCYI